jgi:hypothetical protein
LPTAETEIAEPTGPIPASPSPAAKASAAPTPSGPTADPLTALPGTPTAAAIAAAAQASTSKLETTGETTLRLSEILPDSELRGPSLFGITDDSTSQLSSELLNSAARLQGQFDQPATPAPAWQQPVGTPLTTGLGLGLSGVGTAAAPPPTTPASAPAAASATSFRPPAPPVSPRPSSPSSAAAPVQPAANGKTPDNRSNGLPDLQPGVPDDLFRSRRVPSVADMAAAASAAAGVQATGTSVSAAPPPTGPAVTMPPPPTSPAAQMPPPPTSPAVTMPPPPDDADEEPAASRKAPLVIGIAAIIVGIIAILVFVLYYLYQSWARDPAPPPAPAPSYSTPAVTPTPTPTPTPEPTPTPTPEPDPEPTTESEPAQPRQGSLPASTVSVCEADKVGTLSTQTSCALALNVAKAIPVDAVGDFTIEGVYSPVTNLEYALRCQTRETYYQCTSDLGAILVVAFGREGQ